VKDMSWRNILKSFTPLEDSEEWIQVFINSIYEMQGDLDRGSGKQWFAITDLIQKVAYSGKGSKRKDIVKLFSKIVEIIENDFKNGNELKKKLQDIITRRKGERYG